jgi:hypothetical protein
VHVLPGVRRTLLEVLGRRYPRHPPLVRDPSDRPEAIFARRSAAPKAFVVAALALGFGRAARRAGLPVNDGFSGFSQFDADVPFADELKSALLHLGSRHIVMCHPGHADPDAPRADPLAMRRRMEYDVLMRDPALPGLIWRPSRGGGDGALDWSQLRG